MKTTSSRFAGLAALIALSPLSVHAAIQLQGAGATFPAPLYQRWIAEFSKANPGIQINYQGVGSGAGIKQFTDGLVTFGASDAAMTDAQIAKVKQGVVLIPATAGSIVLAYNLPGVETLKLSREAYVGIFLGKITKWSDPAITKTNEGVKLPDLNITVCTRSDSSGTNFVFTGHLAAISSDFKSQVGQGTSVTWPAGVAGQGNDGVTALIKQTQGAIGYVEYGYAKNNKLAFAQLQNKAGEFVAATPESGAATLNTTQFPPNILRAWPSDPAGKDAYPISSFTWLLIPEQSKDGAKGKILADFLNWMVTDGQKMTGALSYAPLPEVVVQKEKEAIKMVR